MSRNRSLRSVLFLVASLAAAFTLVFVYYFAFYVPARARYFTNHSSRDLAVAGERVAAAIDAYANATRNAAVKNVAAAATAPAQTAPTSLPDNSSLIAAFKLAAPLQYVSSPESDQDRRGCDLVDAASADPTSQPTPAGDSGQANASPSAGAVAATYPPLSVRVEVNGVETIEASSAIETHRAVLEGRVHRTSATLYFRYRCKPSDHAEEDSYCKRYPTANVCTKITLDDLFEPIVSGGTFDTLDPLLLNDDGTVIYQQSSGGLRIDKFPQRSKPPSANQSTDKSAGAIDGLPSVEAMQVSTFEQGLKLSEIEYRLYSQPLHLAVPVAGSTPGAPWVIAGLVTADNVRRQTHAMPIRFLYVMPVLVLIGLLGWPLLKLWAMGPRERLRAFDVFYLAVSAVVASGLVTVALLDIYAYTRLTASTDHEMEHFAEELLGDFHDEMRCADWALKQFSEARATQPFCPEPRASDSACDDPLQVRIFAADTRGTCCTDTKQHLRASYPFLEMIIRTDDHGQQQEKWTVRDATTARISMGTFESFQNPTNDWLITAHFPDAGASAERACGPARDRRLSLSVLVSPNTGETLSTLSAPMPVPEAGGGPPGVVALVPQLISLAAPVTPPGVGFAVIQESGRVLFHSNRFRNLYENFFAEVSDPLALQGPVSARRAASATIEYHGRLHRVFVRPVPDTPWALIVFRDKELLSIANLQIVASAVIIFLLFVTAGTLSLIAVGLVWPDARRDWFWPDPRRPRVYVWGTGLLLALAAWFIWAIAEFHPLAIAASLLLAPLTAAFYAFLLLGAGPERPRRRHRFSALICGAASLGLLMLSGAETLAAPHNGAALLWLFVVLVVGLRSLTRPTGDLVPATSPATPRTAFVSMGLTLLILIAVLPSAALFADSFAQGMEALVRHSQLTLGYAFANRIEHAYERYAKIDGSLLGERLQSHWDVPSETEPFHLQRLACANPAAQALGASRCAGTEGKGPGPINDPREAFTRHFTNPIMANLWGYTIAALQLEEMLLPRAHDCLWETFDTGAGRRVLRLRDERFAHDPEATSDCPGLLIEASVPDFPRPQSPAAKAAAVGIVVAVLAAAFGLLRVLADRIFGLRLDAQAPHPGTAVDLALGPFFLRPRGETARQLADLKRSGHLIDLHHVRESTELDDLVTAARSSPLVVVDHLEHHIEDPKWNGAKLGLLETLVLKHGKPVAVASDVDPLGYFARRLRSPSDPATEANYVTAADLHRWARVLVHLRKVRSDLSCSGHEKLSDLEQVLHEECQWTERLRGIEVEIREEGHWRGMTIGELQRHISDLAEAHYRTLWALATDEERLVLVHLAKEGFVNPQTWPVVRRLMRRRLITREAAFRVMNRSFARFVLDAEPEKVTTLEQAQGTSLWQTLRSGGVILLVVGALFLFLTQPDALNSWLGLFPAIATAAAALAQVLGFFQRPPPADGRAP